MIMIAPFKPANTPIEYPSSDGKRMAKNTLQFEWIVKIKEGLEAVFLDDPNVFIAGDLLWYPVEGSPTISAAPDTMVVFGRQKGYRLSYKQWEEGGIGPQVVFEVLSPSNTRAEMRDKLDWYDTYGVEEYYVYDPEQVTLQGWKRQNSVLQPILNISEGWVSPRLGVRFELSPECLVIIGPNGRRFHTLPEWVEKYEDAEKRAEAQRKCAEAQRKRAEDAEKLAKDERKRAEDERKRAQDADQRAEDERRRAQDAEQRAEDERKRAEEAMQQAGDERKRAEEADDRAKKRRMSVPPCGWTSSGLTV